MMGDIRILLVEDNPDHAFLTERALRDAQPHVAGAIEVELIGDGTAALHRLRDGSLPRPDLVLLDIQLPGEDGLSVLRTIRADEGLRTIPVIMLTTSSRDVDVLTSYGLGANAYVTKPVSAQEFRTKVQAIPTYWSRIATLPPR